MKVVSNQYQSIDTDCVFMCFFREGPYLTLHHSLMQFVTCCDQVDSLVSDPKPPVHRLRPPLTYAANEQRRHPADDLIRGWAKKKQENLRPCRAKHRAEQKLQCPK